jgi:hypothetical protein
VTNGPDAVWASTGRWSVLVPIDVYPTSGTTNHRFASDVAEVHTLLRDRDTYLVMYAPGAPGLATVSDIARGFPVVPVARTTDGVVYRAATRG